MSLDDLYRNGKDTLANNMGRILIWLGGSVHTRSNFKYYMLLWLLNVDVCLGLHKNATSKPFYAEILPSIHFLWA